MTTYLFKNNAISTLAGPISAVATSINVASGSGVLFPSPSGGQVFALTLVSASNPTALEIVYCTAVTGDTLTVVRGREGTTAQPFLAGDFADHRLTAGALSTLVQSGNGFYYAQDTGTANSLVISVPAISALATGMLFLVEKGAAGVTGAAQLTVNGSAKFIIWADGSPLVNGDWPGVSPGLVAYDGTYFRLLTVMGPSVFVRNIASASRIFTTSSSTPGSISNNILSIYPMASGSCSFGAFSSATFTFSQAGVYAVSCQLVSTVNFTGTQNVNFNAQILWNAAGVASNQVGNYGVSPESASINVIGIISASAGDTVQLWGSVASATFTSGSLNSGSMTITKII